MSQENPNPPPEQNQPQQPTENQPFLQQSNQANNNQENNQENVNNNDAEPPQDLAAQPTQAQQLPSVPTTVVEPQRPMNPPVTQVVQPPRQMESEPSPSDGSNQPNDDDINSFIIAIKSGFVEQIKKYLQKFGSNIVNRVQPQTRQPSLYFAAILTDQESSLEILKMLIDKGANAHFKDSVEQTIMFYICREGKIKCMEYLMSIGLKIDQQDSYGQTPLYYAVAENRLNIVEKYTKRQWLNHKDKLAGQTPLFYAARKGHLEMVRKLIEMGLDPTIPDDNNKLATEYAKKAKFTEIADYLASEVKKVRELQKMTMSNQQNPGESSMGGEQQSNVKRSGKNNRKQVTAPKQSYKIVYMNEKGQIKDLTQEDVRKMLSNNAKLESYLANPEAITDEQLNTLSNDSWEKIAHKVMMQTWKQKGAFWFQQPVDPVKFNIMDYFDIITKPMDLGTVKKRLAHNFYKSAQEFVDDIRLVFINCYRYNGEHHDISKCAKEVEAGFQESLKTSGLSKYLN